MPGFYDRKVTALDGSSFDVPECPVCRQTRARPRYEIEGLSARLVLCRGCGLGRLHPMPSEEEIAAFYPDEYYGSPGGKFEGLVESLVRAVGARHVRFLTMGLPRDARVLDVGCGRGVLLASLADRGFEVHGVEISEAAAQGADPRARIVIVPELAAAGYPDDHFDEVIIWHVLEHVTDPVKVLLEAHRILKKGGRLVVAVPNLSSAQARWAGEAWFHLDLPRHLFHFPLSALDTLLDRCGFRVGSEHHFSLRQNPFGWVQSALNMTGDLPRNGLYVLLHQRAQSEPPPFDASTRRLLRLGYWIGMPIGLGLTVFEAVFRTGATVHVVATPRS